MKTRSAVALTREALYRRVWSKPLSAVAIEVGVSGNALAKICNRLLVPYPPRGYWARLSGGQKSHRPRLPSAPEHRTRHVTISSMRAASRRTRTRLKPAERREQLVEIAKEIIVKEGLHAASMKRIASQAGVSETQAYNYFGTREKLFVALARSEMANIQAAQRSDVARFTDHYPQIIASTRTYLRQYKHRGGLMQMLLSNPDVRATLREDGRKRGTTTTPAHAQRLVDLYGVPWEIAVGCTVILSRLCGRAGRLIAEKKVPLESAERLCLALVLRGSRSVIGAYRDSARRSQGAQAA